MRTFDFRFALISSAFLIFLLVGGFAVLVFEPLHFLQPAAPIACGVLTLIYVYVLSRLRNAERAYHHTCATQLAELIVQSSAVSVMPQQKMKDSYALVQDAVRELRQQLHRNIQDAGSTGRVISAAVDRANKLHGRVIGLLNQLTETLSLLSATRTEIGIGPDASEEPVDLTDQISRIRFELESFQQIPKEMVDLLKHSFASYSRERELQHAAHLRLLTELSERSVYLTRKLKTAQEMFLRLVNQLHVLEQPIQKRREQSRQIQAEMGRYRDFVHQVLRDVQNVQESLRNCPDTLQKLQSELSELETIAGKMRILTLNAAVYAAGTGEPGKGFQAISKDMKNFSDHAGQIHAELRTGLESMEHGLSEQVRQLTRLVQETIAETDRQPEHALASDSEPEPELVLDALLKDFGDLSGTLDTLLHLQQETGEALRREQQQDTQTSETEISSELRFQIDRMVIEADRFSERIGSEVPQILKEFGSILDQVSQLHQQYNRLDNLLNQMLSSGMPGEASHILQQFEGTELQLLRDVPKLLDKQTIRQYNP